MGASSLIEFELMNNEIASANRNNNTVWYSNSIRDIRFQMSLRKHVTFVECLRVHFDCPFGIRIQLKKRILSQCRKVKKWFKKLRNTISGKEEDLSPVPSWYKKVFGSAQENRSIEDHSCNIFSETNLSVDSLLTSESSDTVIHSPNRPPLFSPLRAKLNKYV